MSLATMIAPMQASPSPSPFDNKKTVLPARASRTVKDQKDRDRFLVQGTGHVADNVLAWAQRLRAGLPIGWASFAWVCHEVDVGFHFTDQFARVATNVVEVHFGCHQFPFGIDDERTTECQAC